MDRTEILEILDYERGYVALEDDGERAISISQRRAIDEVKGFNIDGIYFSGEFPTIYFKSVTNFGKDEIEEICSIHKKIWNQRRVPFLYVSSPMELRIYNCFRKPINFKDESKNRESIEIYRYSFILDQRRLAELTDIFGRISLESGRFWKRKDYANLMDPRERVDRALIKSLKETRAELIDRGIGLKIVHNLLIRSLFILYLEDREATTPGFYQKYLSNAESYFDILDDKNATYNLFETLDKSFNGNLFPVGEDEIRTVDESHLKAVKNCFWDGQTDSGRLFEWRAFDFSIIPIELISEIYEEFLRTENGAEQVSKDGSFYTPLSLVEFILNAKLPWADESNTDYNLKVIDPACGSGIFLVESYRRLVDRWKFCHKGERIGAADLKKILLNSIYGVEINPEAVKVTAFSLYLAMLDYLEPKHIWNSVRFPFLVFDPNEAEKERQGFNLFCSSSLTGGIFSKHEYDLVVGNPPFKRGRLPKEAQDYLKELDFAQEYVLAFLHRATQLSPRGQIALVAASKILFNKTGGYQNFRKFLFNDTYVEAVYNFSVLRRAKKGHGGQLIPSAVGPVCVIFFRAKKPDVVKERIIYCAPKSPVKRNMVEGVVIDGSDFKFLPREECAKEDSNIWKVAMWATDRDFAVINRLSRGKSLKEYFDSNRDTWHYGIGLHKPDDDGCYVPEFADFPLIPTRKIERFYTSEDDLSKLGKDANYRPHEGRIFSPPMVIIKEGQKNKRFCASYIPFKCVYRNAVFGITANVDSKILKALVAYTNSSFAAYFLFLTASTWGIERERVTLKELLFLPGLIFSLTESEIEKLAGKVDEIIALKKNNPALARDTSHIEKEIDEIIYRGLGLSQRERYLVEDTLRYSLELFQEGETSEAYNRPTIDELEEYVRIICEDINDILQYGETTVWATIYDVKHYSPLNMAAVRFSDREKPGFIEKISSQPEISNLLKEVDHYTYERFSESVYFRKVVKYYNGDTIFLIKPNEKRFWSRSMAMNDADDIIVEVSRSRVQ
jgi:type I restriction-modification system DNA methylase subunit